MRPTSIVAAAVLLAACSAPGSPATTAPIATPAPTASPVASRTPRPTPSEPPSPTSSPLPSGEIGSVFVDPEGGYVIEIDPAWTAAPAGIVVEGIEFWFVAPVEDGFAPNVNVLTQTSGGMSLTAYLELSLQNAPAFVGDFELISSKEIEGAHVRLGRLDYMGVVGGRSLHFLAVVALDDTTAYVATLTTPSESFKRLQRVVEPFLLTLAPS
ncbi:MAG: DUF1795 domain-containing protein [Chloroflexi bacterium]|nr:DUF1795 domain-containing protein [Chloroflexota bacterium]